MSSEICYTDMCRACMKTDGVLLSMFDDSIKRMNLPDKFTELTSIQINKFDGFPNKLCYKCAYRTNTSYEFKQLVQETHMKFLKMFENQKHTPKEEPLDEKDNTDTSMQTNDSFEFILLNDQNIDISEQVTIEVIDTDDKEEVMMDVSHLFGNHDDAKEDNLSWDDVVANLQRTNKVQTNMHPVKIEEPEEITKILDSQQYTIMYMPSESDLMDQEKTEKDCNTFVTAIKILDKQEEDVEEIPHDVCASSPVEYKIVTKEERTSTYKDVSKHDLVEYEEASEENNSNIQQLPLQTGNVDESDSDYFIDPKDNVLGTLNDTITKIKELRQGNSIIYQCTLCLQNYEQLIGVLLHVIDNHVPSTGPFYCVVCEKDCNSHRELRTHAKTHTGNLPYSCFVCSKAYSTKRYLKRHMSCHAELPRFRCPKCGDRFTIKAELRTHVRTHVHDAPFSCSQCSRKFNHKGNYKRHLINHLDPQGLLLPKYPCNVCGKRFPNNRTLETHMRVHTGEKPFSCEICGKSFSQQGNLLNHMRIHSNPRSYTCDVCSKSFNQRATLKDHRLLHTGEKPHVCNVCGIAFTFSAALRRHMWSHKNKKPFRCETCQAQFIGKYDLRRHMQVHTDRPKVKRKRRSKFSNFLQEELKEENSLVIQSVVPDTGTVLIEQVFLQDDVTEVVHQAESEKENVDALFNLI